MQQRIRRSDPTVCFTRSGSPPDHTHVCMISFCRATFTYSGKCVPPQLQIIYFSSRLMFRLHHNITDVEATMRMCDGSIREVDEGEERDKDTQKKLSPPPLIQLWMDDTLQKSHPWMPGGFDLGRDVCLCL